MGKVEHQRPRLIASCPILSTSANNPMRIFFAAIIVLLGANLLVDLLDSNMVQMMEERKQTIERLMN